MFLTHSLFKDFTRMYEAEHPTFLISHGLLTMNTITKLERDKMDLFTQGLYVTC